MTVIQNLLILVVSSSLLSGCVAHRVSRFVKTNDVKGAAEFLSHGGTQRLIPITMGHPFPHACGLGQLEMAQLLHEFQDQLLTVLNQQESKILNEVLCMIKATSEGHLELVKWGYEVKGFPLNWNANNYSGFGRTFPLEAAIKGRHFDIVEYLIDNKSLVFIWDSSYQFLATNYAVELDDFEMVELLLQKGVNPNYQLRGNTALLIAVEKGYDDIARLLVSYGAFVSYNDEEIPDPLTLARKMGRTDLESFLLEQGALDREAITEREKQIAASRRRRNLGETFRKVTEVSAEIFSIALGMAAIYYTAKYAVPQTADYARSNTHEKWGKLRSEPGYSIPFMCANGTYVDRGPCMICPDGSYIGSGGRCQITPKGTYVRQVGQELPTLAPNGSYVSGNRSIKQCPDGTYVSGTRCGLTPNGSYIGVD